MMKNITTYSALYEDACVALQQERLSDALLSLEGLAESLCNLSLKERVLSVKEAYAMLLDYMSRGYTDPDRYRLHRQFLRQTYEVSDRLHRECMLADESMYYTSLWRTLQKLNGPLSLSQLLGSKVSYRSLFELAWTSPVWQQADYEAAHAILLSCEEQVLESSVLVSGVMLGALQVFDPLRFRFLLDVSVHKDLTLRVRALIGVVFLSLKYSHRLSYYPDLLAQLQLLSEHPGILSLLQAIQMQLVLSLETNEIERNLREEILPEMVRKAQQLKIDSSIEIEELQEKLSEHEFNPEWEENGDSSELGRKMRALAEMQMKGADVFMGSFKMLKQKFSFFNVAANWFCPFQLSHPNLGDVARQHPFVKHILQGGRLCDSDKYSFCLFLSELPPMENEMMKKQLETAMGHLPENGVAESVESPDEQMVSVVRSYIQDLYRFFQLFRIGSVLENPFRMNLQILSSPYLSELLTDNDILRQLADFSFGEKHYAFALDYYKVIPADASVFQKIGFCHQVNKDYVAAIEAYEKANLLKSDSAWTLRQLGICYRSLGDYKKALLCFEELERIDSENVRLLLSLSECYLKQQDYDKAFEKLYKADYLSSDGDMPLRALAWCSLLTGRLEQARQYYLKILGRTPTAVDFYNAGHVEWLMGDTAQAARYYRSSASMEKLMQIPVDFFERDARVLERLGLSQTDFRLMVDLLNQPV